MSSGSLGPTGIYGIQAGVSYAAPIGPRRADRTTTELLHVEHTTLHVDVLNDIYNSLLVKLSAAVSIDDWANITKISSELHVIAQLKAHALTPNNFLSRHVGGHLSQQN